MRKISTLQFWFALIVAFLYNLGTTQAADANYFDYLPKYRKFKSHYQIDKIEYRDKRTILYFRHIVQEDGTTTFYGGSHPNSWYLRTPPRMKGLEIQFKMLEMRDIRINSDQKMETLTHVPEVDYETKRGDVITYEIHFVRIPQYIRMIDMIEGENGDLDEDKLNCFDIMVKTKDSPLLGAPENTEAIANRFDQSFDYTKPKNNATASASKEKGLLAEAEKEAKRSRYKNLLLEQTDVEPIDYMPRALTTLDDLKCSERVTLPEVNFRDNEITFAGRVRAIENIKLIAQYLKRYPEAIVRLHGHTDIHGEEYKNLELSKERAMAVKRELVIMGVEYDRVEVYFYGGKQPLRDMRQGGEANRRVEVEAICKPKEEVAKATTTLSNTQAPTPVPAKNTNGTQLIVKEKAN